MNTLIRQLLLSLVILLAVTCKEDETTDEAFVLFSGTVQNIQTGENIENAKVKLSISKLFPNSIYFPGPILDSAITNSSGEFNIKIKKTDLGDFDSYDLLVSKTGYLQTWCSNYPCFKTLPKTINTIESNADNLKMGTSAEFELKIKKANVLNKDSISVSLITQMSPSISLIEPLLSRYYSVSPMDTVLQEKFVYYHVNKLRIRYTIFNTTEKSEQNEISVDLIEKGVSKVEIEY